LKIEYVDELQQYINYSHSGMISGAAKQLDIPRTSLSYRLKSKSEHYVLLVNGVLTMATFDLKKIDQDLA
jgi:hypothetical protein